MYTLILFHCSSSSPHCQSNSMAALTMKVPDWLHRHLVGPKGANIHKIHASHPKVHVNFGDNDLIEIEGPTADAHEVQALIKKQVAELVCVAI